MVSKQWTKVVFAMWGSFRHRIDCKEHAIKSLVDYDYQCHFYYDTLRIIVELNKMLKECAILRKLKTDMADIIKCLPPRYAEAMKLRIKNNKLFWQVAQEMDCSLRNAIYLYNRAIDIVGQELTLRGYNDEIFKEAFSNDKFVATLYERIYENEGENVKTSEVVLRSV